MDVTLPCVSHPVIVNTRDVIRVMDETYSIPRATRSGCPIRGGVDETTQRLEGIALSGRNGAQEGADAHGGQRIITEKSSCGGDLRVENTSRQVQITKVSYGS